MGKRVSSRNAFKHGKFSAESKSIRTWLCFISRNIKWMKAALRARDLAKKISQNELIDLHPKIAGKNETKSNIVAFSRLEPHKILPKEG